MGGNNAAVKQDIGRLGNNTIFIFVEGSLHFYTCVNYLCEFFKV